ncbi:MAG: gliding motility-associated C-terminal domain-containing protein [Bacteroidetes bacterium]|nr:gliding motility-associated C-terminal domain-containing protein [Bacteroidota bacterium]
MRSLLCHILQTIVPGVPAMYVEATLNNVAAPNNSSPIFSNIPISFLCIGQAFHYNHGAFETDGDSITYSFITPRSAANTNVVFAAGYNVNNPISSSPAMTLDASGDILITPTQSEVGVMAIIVREYRNGVLVGSVIRDMQIWTQPCSNILPTATGINGTNNFSIIACPNQPITFTVNSADGNAAQNVVMNWNNAVSGATFTTTNVSRPVGTFTWTPTSADARPQPYTFTVTVQDNNCPSAGFQTYSYDIIVPSIAATASSTPSACSSPLNGTATVIPTGTAPFNYSWTPGGGTSSTISGLGAGTYTVTATDANGCTITATTSVTTPTPISMSTAGSSSVSCRGGNDGAAAISVSGGTPPYTYVWSPSGGTAASASNLAAGTYTVTVTDAHSCTRTSTVNIVQPAILLSSITGSTSLLCNGDATGSVSVSSSGGTTPYAYNWSLGGSTSSNLSGLSAGSYSVTTTDARGCTTITTVAVTEPTSVSGITSTTPATCGSPNGSASISASGGTSPYSYQWNPGGATGITLSGVGAGAYTVVITDAHGCTVSTVAAISNLGGPSVSVTGTHNVLCEGGNDGDATIQVTGGQPPFSYQWNPSVCTGTFASGLQAGSYSVVVEDANNCLSSTVVNISEPNPLQISLTPTHPSCQGSNNGSILSAAGGGVLPYSYSWTNGAGSSSNPLNLTAGTYSVTITDAYGCTETASVNLSQPPALVVNVSTNVPVSCNGGSNGAASVSVNGGTAPYDYAWLPSVGTLPTVVGLEGGTYMVTVTDAHACTQNATIVISEPAALLASVSSSTPVLCNGDSTGSAIAGASGGTLPYTYLWTGSGSTSSSSGNLPSGVYSVLVTDARGCTSTSPALISEPPLLNTTILSPVNVSCSGGNNGMATVLASGGTSPYAYSWSPGGGIAPIASGLVANTYTVTVTDGNSCSQQAIVSINEPTPLAMSVLSTVMNSCFGNMVGSIEVEATGGTSPYSYQWSPTGGNTSQVTNLAAGSYTVSITDANGCTGSLSAVITEPPVLVVSSSTQSATCGASNGSASVVPSGGTPPYSYQWSTGGNTSASLTNVPAGNYSVTVTDAHGCSEVVAIAVSNIGGPTASVTSIVPVLCSGVASGSAGISVSGGTAPFTYQWSPSGGNAATANNLGAGNYSVIVTDGNNCISGLTVVITEPPPLIVNATPSDALCANASDGSVFTSTSGGVLPYSYSWNVGGSTTSSLSGIPAGNYTVTVRDANGCIQSSTSVVSQPSALLLQLGTSTNVNCSGGADGSASIIPSGGTPSYQYSWSPSGGSSATASGLIAGNYSVTLTDANNCQTLLSISISEPAPLQLSATMSNVSCYGGNTGSISLSLSGGTPSYSYAWNNGAPSGPSIGGLTAGNFLCTVTDQHGCTISSSTTISEPPALQASLVALHDVSCAGGNDGDAGVTVQGGTPPYSYSWSPGNGTTASVNGLLAGNYSVRVTDAMGCEDLLGVTISQPSALIVTPNVTAGTCGLPNGSANVAPSGGTPPYSYLWSPGGGTSSTLQGLPAGNYTNTTTDAHGCTVVNSMTVTNSGSLTAAVSSVSNVLCHGGTDGSVAVSVSGGTAPIVYTWTTGTGNTPFAGNLSAGQYSVTITDAFQCVQTLTMTVTEPSILVSAISSFNSISCYAAQDGSASVSVSGGTSPYSYLWNPGYDSTMQISNLNSGNYTVAVTDAHGCTTQSQVTLTEPAQLQVQVSSTPATCGSSNGSATATTNGGTLPYTYQWSPGGMTSDHVTSIPAGSYSVIVTDAHNCQVNLNTFISNIGGPTLSLLNVNPVSCFGGSNGDATIAVLQGTSPYTYQWYPAGGTDSLASNLSAGTYSVLVADVNNCLTGMTVTISEPTALQASPQATDALCSGSADGSASVVISGGTQPYQYDWSTGATSSTATGLSAGSYSVRVTDSNGCTLTQNAVVSEPSPLNTNIHTSDVNCFGGSDGSAMVEITGGSPGYTYSWSNGATVNSVTGIRAGNYNVTITDQHGCSILGAVSLSEPAALALAFTATDALCFGSSDGIAIANISGGTPPYNYQWSPSGGSQEIARDLPAGTYSLSVTDVHGCTQSSSLTIGAPPAIQVITNQQDALCSGSSDAFANVLQTGGTPPYNYQWTNGSDSVSTGPVSAGNYSVQITDQHGCTVSTSLQLTEPSPLVLNVSGGGWICIGQEMNLNANASGGTSVYSYQWSNSNTSASIVVTPTTTEIYTVSVTDAQGCTAAPQSITVNVYPGLMAATAGDDSICVGRSDTLQVIPAGGNGGPYSYSWSTGPTTASIIVNPLTSQLYSVTISDACGTPPVVVSIPVTVVSGPSADFIPNPASGCPPLVVHYRQQGNTPPGTTYMWDFGDGTTDINRNPVHLFTAPGHYTVRHIVTNGMGCRTEASVPAAVEVFPLPEAQFTSTPDNASIYQPEISFLDQSQLAVHWEWDFGDGTGTSTLQFPTYTFPDSGYYTVRLIATSLHGCIDTTYRKVHVRGEFAIFIPDAFTPNEDGVNDQFTAMGIGIKDFEMLIFDRWGAQIFSTKNLEKGWDGYTAGSPIPAQAEVYVYIIRVHDMQDNPYQYLGRVTLVR